MKTAILILLGGVGAPDEWDRLVKELDGSHARALVLVREHRPDRIVELLRTWEAVKATLEKMRTAAERLPAKEKKEQEEKKKKQAWVALERDKFARFFDDQGKPYLTFLQAYGNLKKSVAIFERKRIPVETGVLKAYERELGEGRKDFSSIRSGKESVIPYLKRIRLFREKTHPGFVKQLETVSKKANGAFGPRAKRVATLKVYYDKARTLREGTPQVQAMARATRASAEAVWNERERYLREIQTKHADALAGPKRHRRFQALETQFSAQQKALRAEMEGAAGFRWERDRLAAGVKKIAEGIPRGNAFEQRDIDTLLEIPRELAAACRSFKLKTPPWVREANVALRAVRGKGRTLKLALDGRIPLKAKVEMFLRDVESELKAATSAVTAAGTGPALLKVVEKCVGIERAFEKKKAEIDKEIRRFQVRIRALEKIGKVEGTGSEIARAILTWTVRPKVEIEELRKKVDAHPGLKSLLEGIDGDSPGASAKGHIEEVFTARAKALADAFLDREIKEYDAILSSPKYFATGAAELETFRKGLVAAKAAFFDALLSQREVDKYELARVLKPAWTRYERLTADIKTVQGAMAAIVTEFESAEKKSWKTERAAFTAVEAEAAALAKKGLTREDLFQIAEKIEERLESMDEAIEELDRVVKKAAGPKLALPESERFRKRVGELLALRARLAHVELNRLQKWGDLPVFRDVSARLKEAETEKLHRLKKFEGWLARNAWTRKENPYQVLRGVWAEIAKTRDNLIFDPVIVGSSGKERPMAEDLRDLEKKTRSYTEFLEEGNREREAREKGFERWMLARLKTYAALRSDLHAIPDEGLKEKIKAVLAAGDRWRKEADTAAGFFAGTWSKEWGDKLRKKAEILEELHDKVTTIEKGFGELYRDWEKADSAISDGDAALEFAANADLIKKFGTEGYTKSGAKMLDILRRERPIAEAQRKFKEAELLFTFRFFAAERFMESLKAVIDLSTKLDPTWSLIVKFSKDIGKAAKFLKDFANDPRRNLRRYAAVLTDLDLFMRDFVTNGYFDYLDAKTFRTRALRDVDRDGIDVSPLDTGTEWTETTVKKLEELKNAVLEKIPEKGSIGRRDRRRIKKHIEKVFGWLTDYVKAEGEDAAELFKEMSESIERFSVEDLEEALRR